MSERKNSKLSGLSDDEDAKPDTYYESKFAANHEQYCQVRMPEVDPEAAIKSRISVMEETSFTQSRLNAMNAELLENLNSDMKMKESVLQTTILSVQETFTEALSALKKDYDHRFELQAAENSRLQIRISELKEENNQLQRKLDITISNLQALQSECGVASNFVEEFSTFSSSKPSTARTSTDRFRLTSS